MSKKNKKKKNKNNRMTEQHKIENIETKAVEVSDAKEEVSEVKEDDGIEKTENMNKDDDTVEKDEKKDKNDIFNKLAQKPGMAKIIKVIKIPVVGFALLAIILNYFLEVLSRHSFGKAFTFIINSPTVFFYNAFIIFVTLSLVLFAKRKVFATLFVCVMWILSAFANWIVLNFRTTPFSAIDILMIRNVMTMLDKYMTKWQLVLSIIAAILVIVLLIYLYIRLPKSKSKRHPFRASAYVCMCFFLVYTLTKVAVETQTVSDNF